MPSFRLFLFILLHLSCSSICSAGELELECDVSEDHSTTKSCNVTTIICNINTIHVPLDNNTILKFTNADTENFTSLVFDDVTLHRFPTEIFDQFTQLTHVEATNGDWSSFPFRTFRRAVHLTELNLNRNKITELDNFSFSSATNLLSLHLIRNGLKKMSSGAFKDTPKLEYLDLSHNKLESVDETIFAPLKDLKTLKLNYNELKEIDHRSFQKNEKLLILGLDGLLMKDLLLDFTEIHLHKLSVEDSKIESLGFRLAFNSSSSIDIINAGNTKIRNLYSFNISDDIAVNELDLQNAEIDDLILHQTKYKNFPNRLKALRLSGNKITTFPRNFAETFASLKTLDLSNNDNLEMKKGMFVQWKSLKSLSLESNAIRSIDLEWFTGLPNLEVLDLGNNNLDVLDYHGLIKVLPSLKSLKIDYNKFNCSYLREMIVDLKENTQMRIKELSDVEFYESYSFASVYGVSCKGKEYYEHLYYWTGSLVVIVVALVTAFVLSRQYPCDFCCGKESYEGMTTTRSDNVLTEVARSGHEVNVD